ncbi:hypothetical protein K1X84_00810 [bacterium]|nr:hypothetical protein [bacterium]
MNLIIEMLLFKLSNSIKFCKPSVYCVAVLCTYSLYAQSFKFEHLMQKDGLSQNTITCILQDCQGFMWFGTQDGLNKYDGYEFSVYKNDPASKSSLSDNYITSIAEDRNGNLWIGTYNGGLNRRSFNNEKFEPFVSPSGSSPLSNRLVRCMYLDSEGFLWIGTAFGLNRLNPANSEMKQYYTDSTDTHYHVSKDNNIRVVYEDKNGNLWLGTHNGLKLFDRKTEKITAQYYSNLGDHTSLSDNAVFTICEDASGNLLVGTAHGLNKFDAKTGRFIRYFYNPLDKTGLNDDYILSLRKGYDDNIWIGYAKGGFSKWDVYGRFTHYQKNDLNSNSINSNRVGVIYETTYGFLWVGTSGGGINKLDMNSKKFYHHAHLPEDLYSITSNNIWSIYEDRACALWVGMSDGWVNKLLVSSSDQTDIKFQREQKSTFTFNSSAITAIFEDSKKILWFAAADGGLISYDQNKKKLKTFSRLTAGTVLSICEDSSKTLWIGTDGRGIQSLDRETEKFTAYPFDPRDSSSLSNKIANALYVDHSNNLWIGTDNGLNLLIKDHKKFKKFFFAQLSQSSNQINCVYEDRNHTLWLGTGSGLCKFNPSTSAFKFYTEKDGLINNCVYGILEDSNGYLWMSTNNGLSRFDPILGFFRNYDIRDGLQNNEFNQYAYVKSANGQMHFGGVNGFVSFDPQKIVDDTTTCPIAISVFTLNDSNVLIQKHYGSDDQKITLDYSSGFSVEFTLLNYRETEKNIYQYQLAGFDKNWIYSGSRHFTSYTNLNPGEYWFKTKAANADGVWHESRAGIKIIILSPWYLTWWAYSCFFTIIGGLIVGITRYQNKRAKQKIINETQIIERAKYSERERLRQEMASDFHDGLGDKISQITMLSKFLRTQVNNSSQNVRQSIDWIIEASEEMMLDARDLIWALDLKQDTVYDLALRLKSHYQAILSRSDHKIDFQTTGIDDKLKTAIPVEWKRNLMIIFKEAISNSLKYSNCQTIVLIFTMQAHQLGIQFSDDGIGFDVTRQHDGDGLNNMKLRANALGGQLTVQSELHKGTTLFFTVKLPTLSN